MKNHFEHFQAFIEEQKNGSNSTCLLILPKHGMIISGSVVTREVDGYEVTAEIHYVLMR